MCLKISIREDESLRDIHIHIHTIRNLYAIVEANYVVSVGLLSSYLLL